MDLDLSKIPKNFDPVTFKKNCINQGFHIINLEAKLDAVTQQVNGIGRIQLREIGGNEFKELQKVFNDFGINYVDHVSNVAALKTKSY